ncbi:MAG: 2-hydroxyacyl-CoA dehydratase [Firmicutes bacterium]|nr:2-hydroxyacyl-CoA dehydratase [Bacillota bacterium]
MGEPMAEPGGKRGGRRKCEERWKLPERAFRRAATSALTYEVMRWGLALRRVFGLSRHSLEAASLLAEFGLGQVGMAFGRGRVSGLGRRRPVIWTSAFAPTELLYALDLVPFSPEIASAAIASIGLSGKMLNIAEDHWYARDSCSFHRCAAGAALEGYLPRPDALVAASHLCDGAPKLFGNLARALGAEFYLIDTPWVTGGGAGDARDTRDAGHAGDAEGAEDTEDGGGAFRDALEYYARQLEALAYALAHRFNRRVDMSRFARAIEFSNEARHYAIEVNKLKKRKPCPVLGAEVLGFVAALFWGFGTRDVVRIYKRLYEEVLARAEGRAEARQGWAGKGRIAQGDGDGEGAPERHRLLWMHLKPFYPNGLWRKMEVELGARIVFDEFSRIYWDEMDPERPFESLARKALSHFGYGRIERRIDAALQAVDEYSIDGVIHFSHWGCRQATGGVWAIKEALKARGIPMLVLDGDCVDGRNYSEGQVMTRIEGFLEML